MNSREKWLHLAVRRAVVVRSLKVALVVGPLLIAINYGDAILAGRVTPADGVKMALTALVPYLVATFSAVDTLRRGR